MTKVIFDRLPYNSSLVSLAFHEIFSAILSMRVYVPSIFLLRVFEIVQVSELYRNTDPGADVMKKLVEVQKKILVSNKKEKDGVEKDKLRVLVKQSRLLYGVCDQTGRLQYGQCQV